jgi:tetratricopeptide (TPR) repeat protein
MYISRHLRCVQVVTLWVFLVVLGGCVTTNPAPGASLQEQIAALMNEGRQFAAAGSHDQAIAKFKEAAAKDPNYWQAYLGMGQSHIAKGSWNDAIGSAKKAFELAPGGQDVVSVLGKALFGGGTDALNGGRLAEAVSRYVEYLRLEPGNAGAWLNVGKAYLGQAQFADAVKAFTQGLATGSGAERTALIRGLLDSGLQAFARGDYRNAIDALKEYVKFDPKNLSAYVNLAKAYWQSGDRGGALDAFRKVLDLDPGNVEALRALLKR